VEEEEEEEVEDEEEVEEEEEDRGKEGGSPMSTGVSYSRMILSSLLVMKQVPSGEKRTPLKKFSSTPPTLSVSDTTPHMGRVRSGQ
jgi:hypothetical protein